MTTKDRAFLKKTSRGLLYRILAEGTDTELAAIIGGLSTFYAAMAQDRASDREPSEKDQKHVLQLIPQQGNYL